MWPSRSLVVSTTLAAAMAVSPVLKPGECAYGIPYGVRGLCRAWQTENFRGSRHRPLPAYRATMVLTLWFGAFTL